MYDVTFIMRLKSFTNIFLYFFIQIISVIVAKIYIDTALDGNLSETNYYNINSLLLAIPLVITLVLIVIINFKELKKVLFAKFTDGKTYLYLLIGFGIYYGSIIIVGLITYILSPEIPEAQNQAGIEEMFNNGFTPLIIFSILFLAPITEELIFRYSIVNLFSTKIKFLAWIPYVLSALIFASIHEYNIFINPNLESILQFAMYLVPSLALVITYFISKRNLLSTILLHFIINSLSLIMLEVLG